MSGISFQLMCLALIGLVIVLGQSWILRELRNIGKELGEINDSHSVSMSCGTLVSSRVSEKASDAKRQ
jgi:hypothetical protein